MRRAPTPFGRHARWVAAAALAWTARAGAQTGPAVHAIDLAALYRAADYAFLAPALAERSVVQLGEAVHMTRELPAARLPFVRYLHEVRGFDVLALEGSAVDAWLAMEFLRRSDGGDEAVRKSQQMAWFGLWQTDAMHALMRYVADTRRTPRPLYLTSFDVQVGSGRAYGSAVVPALVGALRAYGVAPPTGDPAAWAAALQPMFNCRATGFPATARARTDAERAADQFADWVAVIRPRIAAAADGARHAAALAMLPDVVRANIALCAAAHAVGGDAGLRAYQVTRDSLSAEVGRDLVESIGAGAGVITWAHHSHLNYNSAGANPVSFGQRLRASLGTRVYTIGFFAGEGRAYAVDDAALFPLAIRRLCARTRFGVETLLDQAGRRLQAGAYFVDFGSLDARESGNAPWLMPTSSRIERCARYTFTPARDFDAAVFVRRVSAPVEWLLPRPLAWVPHVLGLWLDDRAAALTGLAAAVTAGALAWRAARQRRPRHTRRAPPRTVQAEHVEPVAASAPDRVAAPPCPVGAPFRSAEKYPQLGPLP